MSAQPAGFVRFRGHRAVCCRVAALMMLGLPAVARAQDFAYSIANGEVTVTGYTGGEADVVIPATLEGLPVTRIGEDAFFMGVIGSVEIPEGVHTIARGAFRECFGLATVSFPESLRTIGDEAFFSCFLDAVPLPAGVTSVGDRAFFGCGATTVDIPGGVVHIGDAPFAGSYSLTHITVDAANPHYRDIGGVLFDRAAQRLIQYPPGRAADGYDIPGGVVEIGAGALGSRSLARVTLPEGLVVIGNEAFRASALSDLVLPDSVRRIGDDAFNGVGTLTNVAFNARLEDIGAGAFALTGLVAVEFTDPVPILGAGAFGACEDLLRVTLGGPGFPRASVGPGAFNYCSALTDATLDVRMPTLPAYLFLDCPRLTRLSLPANLRGIGDGALAGTGLTEFAVPDSVLSIGAVAFSNSALARIVIPDRVTSLGPGAFADCQDLRQATIGAGVQSIESTTFASSGLTDMVIPDTVTALGPRAFYGCSDLAGVVLGAGIRVIEAQAFALSGLTYIDIPDTVLSVEQGAFSWCAGLAGARLGAGIRVIRFGTFAGSGLVHLEVPDQVTGIEAYAFSECRELRSIDLGNAVTAIGDQAFRSCTSLTTLAIPDSVVTIGTLAFWYCPSLASVMFGRGLEAIGDRVFESCSALRRLYFTGDAPALGGQPFINTGGIPVTFYRLADAAGWPSTLWTYPVVAWDPRIVLPEGVPGARADEVALVILGAAGVPVAVEACADLADPAWVTVARLACGADGTVRYEGAANRAARFYRFRPE